MTTGPSANPAQPQAGAAVWKEIVTRFQRPSTSRAVWQIVNTFVPYALLWFAMHLTMAVSYWATLPLAILAAGFLVRIFIIFHDCGHGSFFKSRTANDVTGFVAGLLTFTPYYHWRWEHAIHHGTAGDLDRRGVGDVWTLTVQEYLEASRWRRFAYRLARNPLVLFVLAPLYMFVLHQRIPAKVAQKRERHSVYWMNLAILALASSLCALIGIKEYLLIQLTVTTISGAAGVWLFYVQHQFEEAYWERGDDWNYTAAALQGSSFYKLPRILQWFSGNIGFHHIHHLSPRIPNYNLQRCHDADPVFQQVKPMTFFASLRSIPVHLWDEQRKKLVGFRHVRQLRKQQRQNKGS
jgi:omega-6 fatty acid desaturase (delta-12 desaturase)